MTTLPDMSAMLAALEQAYQEALTPREEAEALLGLCRFHESGNHKQMLECAEKALIAARRARYREGIAGALKYEARARYLLGEYETAVVQATSAYETYKAIRDRKGVLTSLRLLSIIHVNNGALEKGRQCLLQADQESASAPPDQETIYLYGAWIGLYRIIGDALRIQDYARRMLELAETLNYPQGIAQACNHLGSILMYFKDYPMAISYLNRALELSRTFAVVSLELAVLNDIAHCYLHLGKLDKALDVARQYQKKGEESKSTIVIVESERLLCQVFQERKEYEAATFHAKRMVRMARHHAPLNLFIQACLIRAALYRQCNEPEKAIAWYRRGLKEAYQARDFPTVMHASKEIAEVYDQKGDIRTAYRYYSRYMKVQQQLMGEMKQNSIASAAVAIQMEQLEREERQIQRQIELLKQRLQQKQQELTASALSVAEKDGRLSELRSELNQLLALPPDQSRQALSSLINRLGKSGNQAHAWEEFNRQIQLVDPDYMRTLTERYQNLTPTELKICAMLRINLSTKDVAALLSIEPSSVGIYRSQLRKKLNLSREINLHSFLKTLTGSEAI